MGREEKSWQRRSLSSTTTNGKAGTNISALESSVLEPCSTLPAAEKDEPPNLPSRTSLQEPASRTLNTASFTSWRGKSRRAGEALGTPIRRLRFCVWFLALAGLARSIRRLCSPFAGRGGGAAL